jgi:predicted amino acid dehydrogenase
MALVGSNSRRRRRRKKQTLQEGPHYGIGPRQEYKTRNESIIIYQRARAKPKKRT